MIRFTRPLKPPTFMSPACPAPPWHVTIPGMGGGRPGRYNITLGDGEGQRQRAQSRMTAFSPR